MKKERLTDRDIDRILIRIKDAREYYHQRKNDKNLSEDDREWAADNGDAILMLIDNMCEYVSLVFDDNFKNITRQEYAKERRNDEWKAECERIEFGRKSEHDALITNIKLVDLICRRDGLKEIYGELPEEYKNNTSGLMGAENRSKPGVVETRHKIADWTFQFVLGCAVIDALDRDYDNDIEAYTELSESYRKIGKNKMSRRIEEMTEPGEK